ncbi:MAG: hypothetical protein FJZ47_02735 [Candidatus Tectomicrobia bacterium]|uniref:Uncharacterized protein n=1 Tax=Tectimicrobiota bacterium TaxID=2528274 RepID=A0A937VXG4_UNCTE|nr:hypothetical protein [Candidatus Tectomicrobia bacterium]
MRHSAARRVANIGGRERRQRYAMGLIMLVVSAGLLGLLTRSEVGHWWRLWLMIPLWASLLGLIQAREQT